MATISVPTEQFLTLDAPAQPTMREQAWSARPRSRPPSRRRSRKPPSPPGICSRTQPNRAPAENALTAHTAPQVQPQATTAAPSIRDSRNAQGNQNRDETAFQPMTREQALTRKVAQLRKVAEGGENTLVIGPGQLPQERTALHFAIAAVVIVAIMVLGIGLFAATQAGLFDGLENRIPFLRPNASPRPNRPAAPRAPAATAPVASPATSAAILSTPAPAPSPVAPAATVHSPDVAPGNQPSAPLRAPASKAEPALPGNSAATVRPSAFPREPVPARAVPRPAAAKSPKAAIRPEPPRRAASRPVPADALPPAATASAVDADDGEIPAYAKPRAKAANLGEIVLRASVQAAANIDKDNLLEMYNRYALGFPGLSGEVQIGLTVDPGGRILEGSVVSSSTGVEAFDQELLRKVLDWRLRAFPESRPKFIVVPFLFPLQGR